MSLDLDPKRCSKRIYKGYYSGPQPQCQHKAVVPEDRPIYCRQHDPGLIEARRKTKREESDARWHERAKRLTAEHRLETARQHACRDIPVEALEADDANEKIKAALGVKP